MRQVWYFCLTVFQLIAVFIFAIGYFPSKTLLKGHAVPYTSNDGDSGQQVQDSKHGGSVPQFNKLVFVVIDALRSDFLYHQEVSHFHNLHKLINNGNAIGFTAYSNPPTVTLPRLKGITTGSTPIFLDAILNVAEDDSSSNLQDQDSIIWQFYHSKNMNKIKFYGDDTWLKLFGENTYFQDHDGTNSFFVSDFVEVDHNVTRHIPHNMAHKEEWDVLILHYLGLDHIGHKGGAHSLHMKPKHLEMDQIIKNLYDSVDEDTLIVVLGDHGMNDLGNHGGSSSGETSSGLCFISKKFGSNGIMDNAFKQKVPVVEKNLDYQYLNKATQIDLVPTLMALFGLPIPINNVGIIIPELLPWINDKEFHINENHKQLDKLLPERFFANGNANFEKNHSQNIMSLEELYRDMHEIQEKLLKKSTEYNYKFIVYGFGLLILSNLLTFYCTFSTNIDIYYVIVVGISVLFGISAFGSSFIEEEHQIWWWITVLFYCGSFILTKTNNNNNIQRKSNSMVSVKFILGLLCLRFIRGWNNSGQKFQYDKVMAKLISPNVLWVLNFMAILLPCWKFAINGKWGSFVAVSIGALSCFTYKLNWSVVNEHLEISSQGVFFKFLQKLSSNEELVDYAQFVFKYTGVCLIGTKAISWFRRNTNGTRKETRSPVSTQLILVSLVLILQSAPSNIPLFGLFHVLNYSVNDFIFDDTRKASIWFLLMEHLTFFQFGGTNSINTINLTNAYNGISNNYNIYVIGLLMNIANFSPSIFWALLGSHHPEYKRNTLIFYNIFGICLLASCFVSRYHLFVWSVFSPKLCYYIGWSLFMNFIVKYLFILIL